MKTLWICNQLVATPMVLYNSGTVPIVVGIPRIYLLSSPFKKKNCSPPEKKIDYYYYESPERENGKILCRSHWICHCIQIFSQSRYIREWSDFHLNFILFCRVTSWRWWSLGQGWGCTRTSLTSSASGEDGSAPRSPSYPYRKVSTIFCQTSMGRWEE